MYLVNHSSYLDSVLPKAEVILKIHVSCFQQICYFSLASSKYINGCGLILIKLLKIIHVLHSFTSFLETLLFLKCITAGDKKQDGFVLSASCRSGVLVLLSQKHIARIP